MMADSDGSKLGPRVTRLTLSAVLLPLVIGSGLLFITVRRQVRRRIEAQRQAQSDDLGQEIGRIEAAIAGNVEGVIKTLTLLAPDAFATFDYLGLENICQSLRHRSFIDDLRIDTANGKTVVLPAGDLSYPAPRNEQIVTRVIENEGQVLGSITIRLNFDGTHALIARRREAIENRNKGALASFQTDSRHLIWFFGLGSVGVALSTLLALRRSMKRCILSRIEQLWVWSQNQPVQTSPPADVFSGRDDEIDALARSFDELVSRLRNHHQELEALVLARTEDLEAANAKLQTAVVTAEAGARAKSEFLAAMSHEIRTPMNGVVVSAELLLDAPLKSEQKELVRTIMDSGNLLLGIINDILDCSKIEAGKMEIEAIEVDPREAIGNVVDILAERAHAKGIDLVAIVDPSTPRRILADPTRLQQVVMNLCGNAIKFTMEGEVVVRVEFVESQLKIRIQDTGIGISGNTIETLFDPFSQAEKGTTRRFGGTGLGLTISQRLVTMMGGEIKIESTLGEGSEFSFSIPVEQPPQTGEPSEEEFKGERLVALIERPSLRESLAAHAESLGASCQFESKIQDAIASAQRSDAILIVPATSIQETVASLSGSSQTKKPPIIALCHRSERPDSTHDGRISFLFHPLRRERCVAALRQARGRKLPAVAETSDAGAEAVSVLLVEDNLTNQRVISLLLQRIGAQTVVAENGEAALEQLAIGHFDLVLMDCQMPVMDGLEATRRLRCSQGSAAQIPVIALTASILPEERRACFDAGMDAVLGKPVLRESLLEVLRSWSKRKSVARGSPQTLHP